MHWYDFALHLGISSRVLNVVRVEKQRLISDCCRESLHRWLKHDYDTGEKEREVGVVLEAVRKVCGPASVERIQSGWQSKGIQPASPTSLLLSRPELADLQELVVPFAAAQWEAVADFLQVSYEKRSAIAASEHGCAEVCCRELFDQWLQQLPGTGSLPCTWEVVLDVIQEAVGSEVAQRIRARLDSKYEGEESSGPLVHVHWLYLLSGMSVAIEARPIIVFYLRFHNICIYIYIYICVCLHVHCTRPCTPYASPITSAIVHLEHRLLFGAPL